MRYSKVLIPLAIVSSLCSFVFAEVDTLSDQSLKKVKDCTSGSFGLGNGDGYAGYCCSSQKDCWDDCIKGVCNGKSASKTETKTKTSTKTKTKTNGPAPTCVAGSYGKKNGDGYAGYCCESQKDCLDDCIKGVCNGKSASKTETKTKTSTKNSTKTSTKTNGPAPTCVAGSYGKKNGDGYAGYCCKTEADCLDDCIKGVCNGESATKTKTKTKTSTKTSTKTNGPASTCVAGSYGKKNGDGYAGYCCKTEADCLDDCIKGVCNGESATKTKSKSKSKSKTDGPAPTNCKSGFRGKGRGNGPKNACCSNQADCVEDCVKSKCT